MQQIALYVHEKIAPCSLCITPKQTKVKSNCGNCSKNSKNCIFIFKNKNYYYKKVYLNKFSVQKTTTIKTPIYIEN